MQYHWAYKPHLRPGPMSSRRWTTHKKLNGNFSVCLIILCQSFLFFVLNITYSLCINYDSLFCVFMGSLCIKIVCLSVFLSFLFDIFFFCLFPSSSALFVFYVILSYHYYFYMPSCILVKEIKKRCECG